MAGSALLLLAAVAVGAAAGTAPASLGAAHLVSTRAGVHAVAPSSPVPSTPSTAAPTAVGTPAPAATPTAGTAVPGSAPAGAAPAASATPTFAITTGSGTASNGLDGYFWLAILAVALVALLAAGAGWRASRRRQPGPTRHP